MVGSSVGVGVGVSVSIGGLVGVAVGVAVGVVVGSSVGDWMLKVSGAHAPNERGVGLVSIFISSAFGLLSGFVGTTDCCLNW